MDIYQSSTEYLAKFSLFCSWPELYSLFTHISGRRPREWYLPVGACEAVGGSVEQAIPAVAAVACAQTAILLIDDMLDEDPRGEYRRAGAARTANYAAALQAIGAEALGSAGRPHTSLAALESFNQALLAVAFGQHLDAQNLSDENAYWQVVRHKSAAFFGMCLHLGALLGKATGETARLVRQIGQLYGEMIQIHDDLNDTLDTPASPDWLQGRMPLPILFAQCADHPERGRFMELRLQVSEEEALLEAQDILIRCGAVSFCVDQLLRRRQAAQQVLQAANLARPEWVVILLEEVVAPVWKLFDALGAGPLRVPVPNRAGEAV
ncbi:MAG: polyprenyl synthetase family protein [Chloroflexota bacterium]